MKTFALLSLLALSIKASPVPYNNALAGTSTLTARDHSSLGRRQIATNTTLGAALPSAAALPRRQLFNLTLGGSALPTGVARRQVEEVPPSPYANLTAPEVLQPVESDVLPSEEALNATATAAAAQAIMEEVDAGTVPVLIPVPSDMADEGAEVEYAGTLEPEEAAALIPRKPVTGTPLRPRSVRRG